MALERSHSDLWGCGGGARSKLSLRYHPPPSKTVDKVTEAGSRQRQNWWGKSLIIEGVLVGSTGPGILVFAS